MADSRKLAWRMFWGSMAWVRSMIRLSGAMVSMTPFMMPTYGSEIPKSVMRAIRERIKGAFPVSHLSFFGMDMGAK